MAWCTAEGISTMLTYQLKDTKFLSHAKNYYLYLSTPVSSGQQTMDGVLRAQVKAFTARSECKIIK